MFQKQLLTQVGDNADVTVIQFQVKVERDTIQMDCTMELAVADAISEKLLIRDLLARGCARFTYQYSL